MFILCIIAFTVSLIFQALLWRILKPKHEMMGLLLCFFLAWLLCSVLVWATEWRAMIFPFAIVDVLQFLFYHACSTACYSFIYGGIEQNSPSLAIVRKLDRYRVDGCALEDLCLTIERQLPVEARLSSLESEGLLYRDGNTIIASKRGLVIARILFYLSVLLKAKS